MIGKKILNYEIISVLGKGGMGEVFLAKHATIDRYVAIKALLPSLVGNSEIRQRFINEAKTMSQLSHPNIVGLLDYHEEEDGLYLIMEYIEGRGLDEFIAKESGPIREDFAVNLMLQTLEAFKYAQSKGLVHRDIKPSNLILTSQNTIKVLDFGIAKIIGQETHSLTKTGMQMGTVYYMSPEQVRGQEADIRSDIYSLGVTFYQMLTGVNPYKGITTEYEIYDRIVKTPLEDPRNIYPGVSEHMCQVIAKATHKDINLRFQSCGEFLDAIEKKGTLSSSFSFEPPTKRESRKISLKWVLIPLAVILLGVGGYFAFTRMDLFRQKTEVALLDLFPVTQGDHVIYLDREGNMPISTLFEEASVFVNGLARVGVLAEEKVLYGFINPTGEYIVKPQFKEATDFSEGLAVVVRENAAPAVINEKGESVFEMKSANAMQGFKGGLASFAVYSKEAGMPLWGFVNAEGKTVITPQFMEVGSFNGGRCKVAFPSKDKKSKKNEWSFINVDGKLITAERYDYCSDFTDGKAIVARDSKFGTINENGKLVIPMTYDELRTDADLLIFSLSGKSGWLDGKGKNIIAAQFDNCSGFLGGDLAPVKSGKKWGYVNREGKFIIPAQYDFAYPFNGDRAGVIISGKLGLINTTGQIIANAVYEDFNMEAVALLSSGNLPVSYVNTDFFDVETNLSAINMESPFGRFNANSTYGDVMAAFGMNSYDFSTSYAKKEVQPYTDLNNAFGFSCWVEGSPYEQQVITEQYGYAVYQEYQNTFTEAKRPASYIYKVLIKGEFPTRAEAFTLAAKEKFKAIGFQSAGLNTYTNGNRWITLTAFEKTKEGYEAEIQLGWSTGG
jgi:serine/threonine protein kinase